MVAVTMKRLGEALAELDPGGRALLDLSLRRGLADDEIADVMRCEPEEVAGRRAELLSGLERELGLETREARDELRATLPDLPPELWAGRRRQAARA